MALKNPHYIRRIDDQAPTLINQSIDRLYSTRLESRFHANEATTTPYVFQSQQLGEAAFSATGSPTVTRTFNLTETYDTVLFAQAHAVSTQVTAHVTDITQSAITITCRTVSGTANFSNVTTATIKVYYSVVGSAP